MRPDEDPGSVAGRLIDRLLSPLEDAREREELLSDLEELRRRRGRSRLWFWWELGRYAIALRFDRHRRNATVQPSARGRQRGQLLDSVAGDVRQALRTFVRYPGFLLTALPTIALSVGATTALFSFADALMLRPLRVREPGRLFSVYHVRTEGPPSYSEFSYPDYLELRDENRLLEGLAAWSSVEARVGDAVDAEPIEGLIVSANYFAVLGVEPAVGRAFVPEEDRTEGTHPVVILSRSLVESRFGGDASVVGRTIVLNARPFTVIGIAPATMPSLDLQTAAQFWVPLMMHRIVMPGFHAFGIELFGNRGTHWLQLLARLPASTDAAAAAAELKALAARQAQANPETNRGWSIEVAGASLSRTGPPSGRPLVRITALLAAVIGLVLLIACANVANLLLAKAIVRRPEMGVRMAVGASRTRLIRQALTEALVLSVLGAVAGVVVAAWSMRLMPALGVTTSLPGLDVRMDARTLLFTVALAVTTGALFGIAPALHASEMGASRSGRGLTASREGARVRQSLVVVQVAMALVLLIGAGLTLRTLWNLQTVPLGFDIDRLLEATIDLTDTPASDAETGQVLSRILDGASSIAGVRGAALARIAPFSGSRMANDVLFENGDSAGMQRTNVDMNVVDAGFFSTMGIPLRAGRSFGADDRAGATDVAIVNEALAARLWPGGSAVGRRIWSWRPDGDDRALDVIGVVANGRYYRSWQNPDRPFLFLPLSQNPTRMMTLYVRVAEGTTTFADGIRRVIRDLAPTIPVPSVRAVGEARAASVSLQRTNARLLGLFGILATIIATIGVYGVVAFAVTRRTREIGVRLALGALPGDVRRMVVLWSATPILAGSLLGLAAAAVLVRYLSPMLFGVAPRDPITFAGLAALIVSVGVLASWIPARRATRVDPLDVLRE